MLRTLCSAVTWLPDFVLRILLNAARPVELEYNPAVHVVQTEDPAQIAVQDDGENVSMLVLPIALSFIAWSGCALTSGNF